jgi:hypothetical protein
MSKINDSYTIQDIINAINSNFSNYTETTLMEFKLGMIIYKIYEQIKSCKKDIQFNLENLKMKLFTEDVKNKNLLNLDIDDELDKEEFHKFIVDQINKDGNLSALLEEKRKNEMTINNNKLKIKCDETLLLENFYCIKCRTKGKNILSHDCKHLVSCEDCVKIIKVCPKCGLDIKKYDKIYR